MKDSIEKVIRDLGAIRIENIMGTQMPTNRIGLYPEDYDTVASHFLCPDENNQNQGGMCYDKKKRSIHPRNIRI